jgi:hypothetical protein
MFRIDVRLKNCRRSRQLVRKVIANNPARRKDQRRIPLDRSPMVVRNIQTFSSPSDPDGVHAPASLPFAHFNQSESTPVPNMKAIAPVRARRPGRLGFPGWQAHHQADDRHQAHPE